MAYYLHINKKDVSMIKNFVFTLIITKIGLTPDTKNLSYKTYESLIPLKVEDV